MLFHKICSKCKINKQTKPKTNKTCKFLLLKIKITTTIDFSFDRRRIMKDLSMQKLSLHYKKKMEIRFLVLHHIHEHVSILELGCHCWSIHFFFLYFHFKNSALFYNYVCDYYWFVVILTDEKWKIEPVFIPSSMKDNKRN